MTHEPECEETRKWNLCNCGSLRAAYQRGREDAEQAVALTVCWFDITKEQKIAAAAAARGGNGTITSRHVTEPLHARGDGA